MNDCDFIVDPQKKNVRLFRRRGNNNVHGSKMFYDDVENYLRSFAKFKCFMLPYFFQFRHENIGVRKEKKKKYGNTHLRNVSDGTSQEYNHIIDS